MKKDKYELKNDFFNILEEINNLTAFNIKQNQSLNEICWQVADRLKNDQDFGDHLTTINELANKLDEIREQIEELEVTERRLNDTIASFCPFCYLDIKAAFDTALEAGKEPETFVYESAEQQAENYGCQISEIDPVAAVYERLKSEATREIEEAFESSNDVTVEISDELTQLFEQIEVSANYLATSFDYHQETIDKLQSLINEAKLTKDDLNDCASWFLDQLEIKFVEIAKK